jgi:hypothetical protein
MAISRPFLLALLGVALLGATVFAVTNARNTASDKTAAVAEQPADQAAPAPAPPTPTPSAEPQQLIEQAFTTDLQSASFQAKLSFTSAGMRNVIQASGSFEDNGAKEMPEADVQVHVSVPSMKLNETGGFTTTGDRAWFTRGATGYAVPQSLWSEVVKARESGEAAAKPDSNAGAKIDPKAWLTNVKDEGKEQVGGVQTTHVSAEIDSAKAVLQVAKAFGDQAPLPNADQRLRQSGLTNGKLNVWVGDDKILRRMTLTVSGKGDGGRRVDGNLTLNLSGVNEPQNVVRPAKVKRGMPGGLYGQVANGVLTSVAQSVGADPAELGIGAPVTNSHLKAERAVAENRKVVIFFQNPRALDDKAVADSVRSLDRRTKNVVVLKDDLRNVDRYGRLLENLGVTQAPAIVIIGRSGKATLYEGYVDADSLVQVVADAR